MINKIANNLKTVIDLKTANELKTVSGLKTVNELKTVSGLKTTNELKIRNSLKRLELSAAYLKKAGKESGLRAAALLAGAFVWWCVLYPELCFPQDTYEAVCETGAGAENGDAAYRKSGLTDSPADLLEEENCGSLLQAGEEQVIVKSRLLEWLEQSGYIK